MSLRYQEVIGFGATVEILLRMQSVFYTRVRRNLEIYSQFDFLINI